MRKNTGIKEAYTPDYQSLTNAQSHTYQSATHISQRKIQFRKQK